MAAGYYALFHLTDIIEADGICDGWKDDWLAKLLFTLDFYSYVILGSTLTCSIFYYDIFFMTISAALFLGLVMNYLITEIIADPSPLGVACFYPYQTPAYGTQLLTQFMVLVVGMGLYRNYVPSWWTIVTITALACLVPFEMSYRNVAHPYQLFAGVAYGTADGLFWLYVLVYLVFPNSAYIRRMKLLTYFGLTDRFADPVFAAEYASLLGGIPQLLYAENT